MAAELQRLTGVTAKLHQSYGGVFEIEVDGDLVFSKSRTGRFPMEGEVTSLLQAKVS
ncbi:MAG: Rdx family protein [Candidatus Obscuribacter sp.]|nr:Rdx family protein [Candidatus Obscuribacter sp.]MBK9281928.1 Rdx family protein [Candidatus Obscuribacter sp.]